jgi:hypothetical protein
MLQRGSVRTGECTEVIVETMVLLDEKHNVLDGTRHAATASSTPGHGLRRLRRRHRFGNGLRPRLGLSLRMRLGF